MTQIHGELWYGSRKRKEKDADEGDYSDDGSAAALNSDDEDDSYVKLPPANAQNKFGARCRQ